MDRWTMRELKETDDIDFAIAILNERRRGLTPYSPLGMKLAEAAHTLATIKNEKDRYLARISGVSCDDCELDELEDDTDFSDCEDGVKAEILANDARLKEMYGEDGGVEDEN